MAGQIAVLIFGALGLLVVWVVFTAIVQSKQQKRIEKFEFPIRLQNKVKEAYPHLEKQDLLLVIEGLREYFMICNMAGKRMVAMPSQVVDVAWHEFILFTRSYEAFCKKTLGRFLHHTPAEAMESQTTAQESIKTAWRLSCLRSKQDPKAAVVLPLLFAIDDKLSISDGFKYSLDCTTDKTTDNFCAGGIGCSSSCGGGCSGDSDGSGCSGGCGGD